MGRSEVPGLRATDRAKVLDEVQLGELIGEYDAAILEIEGLDRLENNYTETIKETSEGGKIVSLTEHNELQGFVEEISESGEEALVRIRKRRRELRERRNEAYKAIIGGLPKGRWIRYGSDAFRVERSKEKSELIRVLAKAVEKTPNDAPVRRVVEMSEVLKRGRGATLAYRLAPALPLVGTVFCWAAAAGIAFTMSPDSVIGAVMMVPMCFLIAGGAAFVYLLYEQVRGELDDDLKGQDAD